MRDFKWGFSTLGCPELSLAEAEKLADEFDFHCLELRMLERSPDLPALFSVPEKFARLKRLAEDGRVRVLGSSFGLASRRNDREELAAFGQLADAAGIPWLRVFGGFDFNEEFDAGRIAAALENLAWFRSLGFRAKLALETHDGCSSSIRCRRLIDRTGGELSVIWDVNHTCRIAGETFPDSWALLAGHVIDVHVKDSRIGPGGEAIPVVPGAGTLPIPEALDLLEEADYTGPVTLEYEKHWHPALPEIRIALEAVNRLWRS